MSDFMDDVFEISSSLGAVFRALMAKDGMMKTKAYALIAERLSDIAGKTPAWSGRYVSNILKGDRGGAKIREAAIALIASGWVGDDLGALEPIVGVLANPLHVSPGSLVLGHSRSCDREGCDVVFVPASPAQRHCPGRCRELAIVSVDMVRALRIIDDHSGVLSKLEVDGRTLNALFLRGLVCVDSLSVEYVNITDAGVRVMNANRHVPGVL